MKHDLNSLVISPPVTLADETVRWDLISITPTQTDQVPPCLPEVNCEAEVHCELLLQEYEELADYEEELAEYEEELADYEELAFQADFDCPGNKDDNMVRDGTAEGQTLKDNIANVVKDNTEDSVMEDNIMEDNSAVYDTDGCRSLLIREELGIGNEDLGCVEVLTSVLDSVVKLPHVVGYVFSSIARTYDEVAGSDLYSEPVRRIFRECVHLKEFASPNLITGIMADESGGCQNRLTKLYEIVKPPAHGHLMNLYPPLPKLLELYDRLEAKIGRGFFRLLYRSEMGLLSFLETGSTLLHLDTFGNMFRYYWTPATTSHVSPYAPAGGDSDPAAVAWPGFDWLREFVCELDDLGESVLESCYVLDACHRKYCDDQVYNPMTNPCGLPVEEFTKSDSLVLVLLQKTFGRLGFVPPIQFKTSDVLGYHLCLRRALKPYTLIGEYSGVIECRRWNTNQFFTPSDSIYDLVNHNDNSNTTLCLIPEPYTSLPRYINGINNHIPDEYLKINTITNIFHFDHQYHILTLTNHQTVKKGQQLLLDYNAGAADGELGTYPTQHFLPAD